MNIQLGRAVEDHASPKIQSRYVDETYHRAISTSGKEESHKEIRRGI
jgi:hypothetical protein